MAFFGMFQVSEQRVRSHSYSSDRTLLRSDVEVVGGSVQISLCHSKTDQLKKGMQVVLGPCGVRDLCLEAALMEYLGIRGDRGGPLFIHANGTPLTKHQFCTVSSRALKAIGLLRRGFCTHFFGIGAASKVAGMEYQAQDIQMI